MAFRTSQWPYSPDPRLPTFNAPGWNFGQVPPWAWWILTTGATGSMRVFNDGVLVKPTGLLPEDTVFENVHALANAVTVVLSIKGTEMPIGPGAGFTKSMGILVRESGVDTWGGGLDLLYPVAIQTHGPFNMVSLAPSAGAFTAPCSIKPAKWNTP